MRNQMCLEWKNLEYSVPGKKPYNYKIWKNPSKIEDIEILKKVNGCLNSGNLTAILGASGAGKTTLLAAISQRLRGNLRGDIFINGTKINRKEMSRISCFLPQYDISVRSLTAFEHLFFMCHFKMDKRTLKAERIQKINDLLFRVGLKESTNTRLAHLSGGERKRLSLAEELLIDPPFVFCDEPTTGLDSYNAFSVIKTLRQLTKSIRDPCSSDLLIDNNMELQVMPNEEQYFARSYRRGVICSVHQPTSDVFELFTHIILMNSGEIIYQGSTDDACLFFSKLGYICPRNCNPGDFYINMISDEKIELKTSTIIRENYEQQMKKNCPVRSRSDSYDDIRKLEKNFKRISWFTQIFYLILKTAIETKRSFKDEITKVAFFMITPIILAILYSNVPGFTQSSIQDIQGSIFMFATELIFTFSYAVVYELPSSLPKIRRECGENLYKLSAFFIAKFLALIPKAFIVSFLCMSIIYPSVKYSKDFLTFVTMSISLSMSAITATSYGLFISSITEHSLFSAEIAVPFDLTLLMFSGMYYNINRMPFVKYLSLFFYANEALSYDYWHDIESIDCKINGFPCLQNGTEVLINYSFSTNPYTIYFDYIGLAGFSLVMNLLAYFKFRRYVRRAGFY